MMARAAMPPATERPIIVPGEMGLLLLSEGPVADGGGDEVVESVAATKTVVREPCAFVDVTAELESEVTDGEDNAEGEEELTNEAVDAGDVAVAVELVGVDVGVDVVEGGVLVTAVVETGFVDTGCVVLAGVLCAEDDCAVVAGWLIIPIPCLRTR